MEVKIKKQIVLILSEPEAVWLKHTMQNPLHDNENVDDQKMREMFWRAIQESEISDLDKL